jgi:quinol monooxygenase YgiN
LNSTLRSLCLSPADQRRHQAFAIGAGPGQVPDEAVYLVTHVDVPPPRREETEALLKTEAESSRTDPGNLRYDVFQQLAPRTNHFTVFATWSDENAFGSHELQSHTREFREALGPMLGAPYDERIYKQV